MLEEGLLCGTVTNLDRFSGPKSDDIEMLCMCVLDESFDRVSNIISRLSEVLDMVKSSFSDRDKLQAGQRCSHKMQQQQTMNPRYEFLDGFNTDKDDDDVVSSVFYRAGPDACGFVSWPKLLKVLTEENNEANVILTLEIELQNIARIDLHKLQSACSQIPARVRGHRVQWAGTLGLHELLAQHLKPGTLSDGLQGIKLNMTQQDLMTACDIFCKGVPALVLQGWNQLKMTPKTALTETANSKYAMTDGALFADFVTLNDFYMGPEARIGYPNPDLMKGLQKEHCVRLGSGEKIVSDNYSIWTAPLWEWWWVKNPSSDDLPADLQSRVKSTMNLFPGEVGDSFEQTLVKVTVKAQATTTGKKISEKEQNVLNDLLTDYFLFTEEERSRGICIRDQVWQRGIISLNIVLPVAKEKLSIGFEEKIQLAVAQATTANHNCISVIAVLAIKILFCDHVDEEGLLKHLSCMDLDSLKLYLHEHYGLMDDACSETVYHGIMVLPYFYPHVVLKLT